MPLEEECDDEDDPEYNFLADIDEPDVEDYRDDKAVRITSQYTHAHTHTLNQFKMDKKCFLFPRERSKRTDGGAV